MNRLGISPVIASTPFERLRGLLGTDSSWGAGGRVLVLVPCKSIHTYGMRYRLDIAFVDKEGSVLRAYRDVGPGTLLSCRRAAMTIERPASDARWFAPGARIVL